MYVIAHRKGYLTPPDSDGPTYTRNIKLAWKFATVADADRERGDTIGETTVAFAGAGDETAHYRCD